MFDGSDYSSEVEHMFVCMYVVGDCDFVQILYILEYYIRGRLYFDQLWPFWLLYKQSLPRVKLKFLQ